MTFGKFVIIFFMALGFPVFMRGLVWVLTKTMLVIVSVLNIRWAKLRRYPLNRRLLISVHLLAGVIYGVFFDGAEFVSWDSLSRRDAERRIAARRGWEGRG